MKINLPLIAATALLTLSACGDSEPEVIGGTTQGALEDETANAAPVELPPMVAKSETYRCKDNSLIFVDYMSDDKTVHLRVEKKDTLPTILTKAEEGDTFSAEGGYSITGTGDVITAELPGKGSQSCKS